MEQREPLQYSMENYDKPNYFRIYECEHITDGTYGGNLPRNVIPVGEHSNILLCRHCWQHVKGMVLEEMVKASIPRSVDEWREVIEARERNEDAEQLEVK